MLFNGHDESQAIETGKERDIEIAERDRKDEHFTTLLTYLLADVVLAAAVAVVVMVIIFYFVCGQKRLP